MPYCKHCGNKIIEDARFCNSCSAPMDAESIVSEQEKVLDLDNLYIDSNKGESVGQDIDENAIFGVLNDLPEDSEHLLPRFKEPKKRKGLFGLFRK